MPDPLPPAPPQPAPGLLWNPYLQIFVSVLLTAASQILLKLGADGSATNNTVWSWLGLAELSSGWTWLGIVALIASFGSWLYALRFLPLGLAFAISNGVNILVPVIGAWLFLHEKINLTGAGGIVVVILGILLLTQSVAKVEERV